MTCRRGQVISMAMDYYAWLGWGGGGGDRLKYDFYVCFILLRFYFIENITGRLYFIQEWW